jgi:coenzyme F420 hydrogenase subunit beta
MIKSENRNVNFVTENNLCLSCGFCEPVCPEKAITIKFNPRKGYHEPIIDDHLCKNHQKCLDVCPGYEVNFPRLNSFLERDIPEKHQIGIVDESMVLYSSNLEIRKNAASGGIITELINFLFDNNEIVGAYVTRPSKENAFEPEGFIARNKEELLDSQMSIYNSVPFGKAVNELKEIDGKIVFVGIPCQTHGLLKYLEMYPELKSKIYVFIGTFCGGYQTSHAHKYYFPKIGVNFDDMKYVDYRYGEFPGQLNIGFKDGTHKEYKRRFTKASMKNNYNTAFNSSFYVPRCYTCADKGNILTDISAGDPWLPKFSDEKLGKSLIVTRTRLGKELIQRAIDAGYIIREDATFDDVMEVQKFDRERHGNQAAYEKVYKFFGKEYPRYTYLGENKIFNIRIYIRVLFDIVKPFFQLRPKLWFILMPMYYVEANIRNIFIFSNPYKYFKRKFKK